MSRTLAILLCFTAAACGRGVYLEDGVTDGDTFYLAEQALVDDDPVLQSWVTYSLSLSTCKLALGGENPARDSSFGCELTARRHLLESWEEKRPPGGDDYLDTLLAVRDAGYLREYVVRHYRRPGWTLPEDLDMAGFRAYRGTHLGGHRPEKRLVGSWNYARNVRSSY